MLFVDEGTQQHLLMDCYPFNSTERTSITSRVQPSFVPSSTLLHCPLEVFWKRSIMHDWFCCILPWAERRVVSETGCGAYLVESQSVPVSATKPETPDSTESVLFSIYIWIYLLCSVKFFVNLLKLSFF